MDYEIMELQEKTVWGLTARTNNMSPDMGTVIGGLWNRFFTDGVYESIPEKSTGKTLGIYSGYAGGPMDDYDITVGCETTAQGKPLEGLAELKIPAGKYARFVVKGHVQGAVAKFWEELWQMDLDRTFVADFEEYQDSEMENAEIHIYIGIK